MSLPDFPAFLEGLIWPARISERTCEAGMPNRRFRSFESNSCISSASRLAGGGGCRGTLRRLALLETRRLRAARIDACPQRFHQIDHVAAGGGGRRFGERDLLAFDFLLNRGLDASLELVVVLVRIEALRGQMVDELLRELELGLGHGSGLYPQVLELAHLLFEVQLMHGESVLHGTDDDDVLLAPRYPASDRALSGLAQGRGEQGVGFGAALVGCEVIGTVEVQRIDRFQGHERS